MNIGDAGYCSRDGKFGAGVTALRSEGYGVGISNFHQSYVVAAGVESAGSIYVRYVGPRGSRVYSPLTSVIEAAASQAAVKRAFGLDNGVFSLASDRDLTLFDPADALASSDDALRREGARIAAANIRATATTVALSTVVSMGARDPYDSSFFNLDYQRLGTVIAANDSFLFENARMTQVLTGLVPAARYRADVLSAAAHLIDAYAAAVGVQVADNTSAAQFTLGIRGYLEPELVALLEANTASAATAALATTTATILDRTAIFRETVPFPATGFFFPSPDFFTGTSGTPLTLRAGTGSGFISILSNDVYAKGFADGTGLGGVTGAAHSVTVPAAKSTQISATLVSETITVNALAGFRGTSYFDYHVRHQNGEEGTARIYVLFR